MKYNSIQYILLISISIVGLLGSQTALAVVYVDQDRPGGDGTSWAQAYKSLEVAVNANISSGKEFWIAEGTYTPSATILIHPDQNHSFYGGFEGNETSRDQREIKAHPVTIDGQGSLEHVFYVLWNVNNVRFDGLTIQGGAALGAKTSDTGQGGGILVNQVSSLVITDCTFKNNTSRGLGGALTIHSSTSVSITNSTFTGNSTLESGGGAIALYWDQVASKPAAVIDKCSFQGNQANVDGGAVYSGYYPITIKESTFIGNTSSRIAGALKLDYNNDSINRIERCLFLNNEVTGSGAGGALQVYAQSVEVENSVFAFNSTIDAGGAVGLHSGKDNPSNYNPAMTASFNNCTFYGNHTDGWAGALSNTDMPMVYIYNSIMWGNSAGQGWVAGEPTNDFANFGTTSLTTGYSDIQTLSWYHGVPAETTEIHEYSFSADPLFVDPDGDDNIQGTQDDNLSILSNSPCTDGADGNNAAIKDIVFRSRIDNTGVGNTGIGTPDYGDIGAYEGPYYPPAPAPDNINMIPALLLLKGIP